MKTTQHTLLSGKKTLTEEYFESLQLNTAVEWSVAHSDLPGIERVYVSRDLRGYIVVVQAFSPDNCEPYHTGMEIFDNPTSVIGALRMLLWI